MTWQKTITILLLFIGWTTGIINGQKIEIQKLNINTSGSSEFAPTIRDSVLYFISNRRNNLLITYMNQNNELLYHIFKAPLNTDGTFDRVSLFAPPGQPKLSAGSLTFSKNDSFLIATYNRKSNYAGHKNQQGSTPLGLYVAENSNGGWHNFREIPFNIPRQSSVGQPSLSGDGKLLFFVSDMDGGYGNTDIYYSLKTGDEWGEPVNVGASINTEGKELFPFIHSSGKLYFTSNGHNNSEGFNIYYIDWTDEKAVPIALPSPINSVSDDFSCFISKNEKEGYFASNRSGNDEIYKFTIPTISCSNPKEVVKDNYCFTFFENGPFKSDSLPYIYRWDFGDGQVATGLEADHCFPGPGDYNINLNVIDTLINKELFSVASYHLNLKKTKQIWFETPDTIRIGETLNSNACLRGYEDPPDEPVFYWDFGDGENRIGKNITYIYHASGSYSITCSTALKDNQEICFFRKIVVLSQQ
jgi:hypothetical protein